MTESLSLAQLGLSVAAGSLTTLSPCVFPILPLVVGGALQANRLAPLAMGGGMAASFALIGLLVGALGPALGIDGDRVRGFGAVRARVIAYADRVRKGFGVLILGAGLAILSGTDKWLEARIVTVLPDSWIALTTLF